MKRWTYFFGFLFAATLIIFQVFKLQHRAFVDEVFYLFAIISVVFFTLLIFTALRHFRR